MRKIAIVALLLGSTSGTHGAGAGPVTIVACAPGYPGTTAEAQPSMDAFAAAAAAAAGWPRDEVAAVYQETEQGGLERLAQADAAAALVPLPFLAKHGSALALEPRLQVEEQGNGLMQRWTLVARRGRVTSPAGLAGFAIASSAGYAPEFVRRALGGWGQLPASARIVQSTQVLSSLRKAAAGEDLAVLLDATQSAALGSLPFAADLEAVARSEPLPVAFVCTVGKRLPASRWKALEASLVRLPATAEGAAALEGIRTVRFASPDAAALALARSYRAGGSR